MNNNSLAQHSQAFLDYLEAWLGGLPVMPLTSAMPDPARSAIISVDVINGFCYDGPLSSPRVATIVAPIASLFERAWQHGLRHILLTQDTHEPQAVEFAQFPPHCVRGTPESQTVDAFRRLPFFSQITVLEKNSIASGLNKGFSEWLDRHPEIDTFITVGDCTDLCTYQLAMHLRLDANARQLKRRVIVPVNCVDTYDRTLAVAAEQGGLPHPANLLHAVFLYHMQLNGIEIVSEIS